MKMTKLLKSKLFIITAVFSVILNIVFFYVDMLPSLMNRFDKPKYLSNIKSYPVEKLLVNASYQMFISDKMHMAWERPTNFIGKVKALNLEDEIKIYNFPRAYLALGLIKYSIKTDSLLFKKVSKQFDDFYVLDDSLNFKFRTVDHVPIGLCAIELYKYTKDDKYKNIADEIFNNLLSTVTSIDGFPLILYRNNQNKVQLVDAIGMICPFLIEYG
nr:glycoside hydrolase family 88 protein [Maribacter vaceletii]